MLIAICRIHEFHLHFRVFTWYSYSSSFAHWRFVFSKICMGCFRVLLGRNVVFGFRTKNLKNLKTFLKI